MSLLSSSLVRSFAIATVLACLVSPLGACGGKASTESGSHTSADGGQGGGSGGGSGGGDDAATCVDVDLSSYDQSCNQDSDCVGITAGEICSGSCGCGGAVINVDGQARWAAATAGLLTGDCPCFSPGQPTCIAHVCTLCEPGAGGNCSVTTDDAGPPPEDSGNVCVTVNLSSYDLSCQQTSDCIAITSGTLCSNGCLCGGSAINVDGQAQYEQAISALPSGEECGCPYSGSPACVQGECVICGGYQVPQPSGCPDGGF
jgi:hypothetical protein